MRTGSPGSFATQLKALREAAGFTQEELATIAGLSVHAVSALERGERRRPHVETVRALSAALDLTGPARDALLGSARAPAHDAAVDEFSRATLPVALTPLLGRDDDVQMLRRWLSDASIRLITLIGPGGVGKTRLALEVARAASEETRMRVVFLGLAPIQDPAFVPPAVAEVFGLSDVTAVDLPKRIQSASSEATVLVLDNFEHVLEAASLVSDLLASVPSLRVLATSRAPLRVRGEREYAVGPLALDAAADSQSPADLARVPAVRLFVERVRDVRPDFRLTVANGPTVRRICRRLDALPLALELAAPWIKVLTVDDLARRLEDDVLLSSAGPRDLPARQQTMNATVAWSYQLLDEREQQAFRRLAVLPARFSFESASDVLAGGDRSGEFSDQVLDVVASLIDRSLILRAEGDVLTRPLFRMFETVRAYAALELAAAGERDEACEGLARYCVKQGLQAEIVLAGAAQAAWLDRTREDLENHRAALTWLIERERAGEACYIAWGLLMFWLIRGHAAEGLRWYEQILKAPGLRPDIEAKALVGLALMQYSQGVLEPARQGLARALTITQQIGDHTLIAHVRTMMGHVEHGSGNVDAARAQFSQAAAIFKSIPLAWATGSALSGWGGAELAAGNVSEAERLLDEAALVLRGQGPWFLTPVRCFRAVLAVQRGRADETIALMRESLTHIRELHDKYAFVYALVPLAAAAMLKGDPAWAARIHGARTAVSERTGARVVVKVIADIGERVEQQSREQLGPERWARAYSAGRAASIDTLLKDIDAHLNRPT
jgi:predicted ATPase/DNA-binding XRE family transcriptional regulator